ncbi:MAG: hypothetical protein ABIB47_01465 [Candidatus Woesearchaeota archaeon]
MIERCKLGFGNLDELRTEPVEAFQEYVSDRIYHNRKCDITKMPQRLIRQLDRLVKIYNSLIAQEEIDIDKLSRVVNLASKTIYGFKEEEAPKVSK